MDYEVVCDVLPLWMWWKVYILEVSYLKKCIIVISCIVTIVVVIAVWQAPKVIEFVPRDLTMDEALNEMPNLYITSDEIALLNRIMSAPDLGNTVAAAITAETPIAEIPYDKARNFTDGVIPENSKSLIVSVGMDSTSIDFVSIDYHIGNRRFMLSLFGDDRVEKIIAVRRLNGSLNYFYENSGNDTFRKYQVITRLFGRASCCHHP